MQKTAEFVSLGHPDKTADYISSYILDRALEQDPNVRYAVEVMLKGNTAVLGGEVSGQVDLSNLREYVIRALADIGYTQQYAATWGECAIEPDKIKVIDLIGLQSAEIAQGIEHNGWGDQGVFVGYACQGEGLIGRELFLARQLNNTLYQMALQDDNFGLDIKTQVTLEDDGQTGLVIAAVPMRQKADLRRMIADIVGADEQKVIVNGTGCYTHHSAVADCGITGRKLAVDFYSTACPIGGGSPWTKDASKADVTLNIYARKLAADNLADNDECFVYLSSCIGRCELPSAVIKCIKGARISHKRLSIRQSPRELIADLGLDKPVFAQICREGISEFALRAGK